MSAEQAPFPNPATIYKPGDRAAVELTDEIIALKPARYQELNEWAVTSEADPREMQQSLREGSFGDMILPEGFSLVQPEHRRHHTFFGHPVRSIGRDRDTLKVNEAILQPVSLSAGGGEYVHEDTEKYGPNFWQRSLSMWLLYKDEEYLGGQKISIFGDSRTSDRGGPFRVMRTIASPILVRGSYDEGLRHDFHSSVQRGYFRQEELVALVGLYRQAFETRVPEHVAA